MIFLEERLVHELLVIGPVQLTKKLVMIQNQGLTFKDRKETDVESLFTRLHKVLDKKSKLNEVKYEDYCSKL